MAPEINITQLANMLKGRVIGKHDEGMGISGTCAIDCYIGNKVSFVKNKKYLEMLARLQNAVVLIPEDLAHLCQKYPQNTYIAVKDALNSMMDAQDFFYGGQPLVAEKGISGTAKIDDSARIGEDVYIGENVYIGKNALIGDRAKIMHGSCLFDDVIIDSGTYIYPGVCIYKSCRIGSNCIIHSGARVGVDGFRFEQDITNKIVRKMHHAGKVLVGNRVEIGANTAIDRATFEDNATTIFDDVKIDNLVHIGHNAKIGARTLICALSCIGGSAIIGEDVWIGIGVTISNSMTIGNRAKILLNAVVAYDVAEGEMVSGFYAMPHKQWKRVYQRLKHEDEV